MLDAKVVWPLFPILLLIVVMCLTWALVAAFRKTSKPTQRWLQVGALVFYLLAAGAAIASEGGHAPVNLHRPFSLLAQVCIVAAIVFAWRQRQESVLWLNSGAWGAILADTALHFLVR